MRRVELHHYYATSLYDICIGCLYTICPFITRKRLLTLSASHPMTDKTKTGPPISDQECVMVVAIPVDFYCGNIIDSASINPTVDARRSLRRRISTAGALLFCTNLDKLTADESRQPGRLSAVCMAVMTMGARAGDGLSPLPLSCLSPLSYRCPHGQVIHFSTTKYPTWIASCFLLFAVSTTATQIWITMDDPRRCAVLITGKDSEVPYVGHVLKGHSTWNWCVHSTG